MKLATVRMHSLELALVATLMASPALAGTIVGSEHDFSTQNWNSQAVICEVCHTPHNAVTSTANAPLWNHAETVATFQAYTSLTMDAADAGSQPTAASKLCLSCHDGTVAVDSFGGTTGTEFITGGALIGTNLTDDHPVSITYDAALFAADGGLVDPATTVTIGAGAQTRTGPISTVMLRGNKVECSSCHDVHNTFTAGNHLLVRTNASSALCLTCHAK